MSRELPLLDTFGRIHDNLRVSVTDRCNIRCFYCMPEEKPDYAPRGFLLSFEEIERFVRIAVRHGVRKLRVTGGEPLVRRDLPVLIRALARIPGVEDLALTTNGVLLPEFAEALYQAGLRRINVHLDTLDPQRFQQITRRPGLEKVLEGIFACKRLGFHTIKINAVAVRGLIEDDLVPLAHFGREHGCEVRFIEFMPLDADGNWQREKVFSAAQMLTRLGEAIAPLEPVPKADPRAPATEYRFSDGVGKIGMIASITQPFCGNCNRLRLTADGKLRYCLFAVEETDIRALLRGQADEENIAQAIRDCVSAKWEGHEINTTRFVQPSRPMHAIGG